MASDESAWTSSFGESNRTSSIEHAFDARRFLVDSNSPLEAPIPIRAWDSHPRLRRASISIRSSTNHSEFVVGHLVEDIVTPLPYPKDDLELLRSQ